MQSSIAALSRTVFVCTWLVAKPSPPSSTVGPTDTRMRDGLSPTPPHQLAGMRIEPPMSEPWAIGTMPAATAAAAPPDEPPAERGGHRVLRRRSAAERIQTGSTKLGHQETVDFTDHAAAQSGTELDLAALLMSENVLHQERHATKRTLAQAGLIKPFDAVWVGFDNRPQLAVESLYRLGSQRGKFPGRDFAASHELGKAQGIV
jgi:hypothetical protein